MAVKAIDDSWPPDDETVARDLSAALTRGADAMGQGAQATARAGADALAAWQDAAGALFGEGVDKFAQLAGQVDQSIRAVGAHAEQYGAQLESAKNTITSTIAANEQTFAQLANPLLGPIAPTLQNAQAQKIANDLRTMIEQKAAELAGAVANSPVVQNATGNVEVKGPNTSVEPINPKLGVDAGGTGTDRFGRGDAATRGDFLAGGGVKASANLAEVKATGQTTTADGTKLSGTATGNIGVNGKAIAGISQDGATLGLSGQAGITGTVEGKVDKGIFGAKATGTGFVGAEAEANLTAGKEGISGDVGAFAGAKARGTLGGDVGGLGAGVAGEAWAGIGAQAEFTAGFGEDGKFHLGGGAGAGLGIGGKISGEITVDPAKIVNTVNDASKAIGDTVNTVSNTVNDTVNNVSNTVNDTVNNVSNTVNNAANTVGNTVNDAANAVRGLFD